MTGELTPRSNLNRERVRIKVLPVPTWTEGESGSRSSLSRQPSTTFTIFKWFLLGCPRTATATSCYCVSNKREWAVELPTTEVVLSVPAETIWSSFLDMENLEGCWTNLRGEVKRVAEKDSRRKEELASLENRSGKWEFKAEGTCIKIQGQDGKPQRAQDAGLEGEMLREREGPYCRSW